MNQGRNGDPPKTADDLFGDLVDEKSAPAKPAKKVPTQHTGPIKVRVAEPGAVPKAEPLPEELAGLLSAFDEPASRDAKKADAKPTARDPGSLTPTATDVRSESSPAAVDPLPDLEELGESEHDAEAMSEFLQLTRRLPVPKSENSRPTAKVQHVDLASVAELAIDAATPAGTRIADAVLPLPRPEPPGIAYGPYRLLEKIATGGMAEVFRAKRTGVAGFEKIVAVKRILPHLSYNKEFVEMFVDEAKLVAGLQHTNIVQIFDLGKIGASYYIAMEYVAGVDLRSILRKLKERKLRMPLDLAMFVVSQVAAGLAHAHQSKDGDGRALKIVHRDVSPQNILISWNGEVKLTDFGIAKAASKATTTEKGALRGKLMYMSPEQAWAKPVDHRSDLFALGIVLYELISDQRPFLGSSDMSLLEKVRQGTVAPPSSLNPEIPARLEKLVMKALEKEPADRQRDAGAMHEELEAILQEPEHAVAAKDLTRFVRILFDRTERAELASEPAPAGIAGSTELEVDLEGIDEPSPDEPLRIMNDPMSVERLLKRFH